MALAKKPAAKAQEPETQEPQTQTQEPETQEPQTQASGLAKFQMERGAYLVQPSTGIRIAFKEVKELKDDSWAEVQVGAGLLKRVK